MFLFLCSTRQLPPTSQINPQMLSFSILATPALRCLFAFPNFSMVGAD